MLKGVTDFERFLWFVVGLLALVIASIIYFKDSEYDPHAPVPLEKEPFYRSKKSQWEMDGYELDELNKAWDTMPESEKRKQLQRDFGPLD